MSQGNAAPGHGEGGFNPAELIIGHVSNSPREHPLIPLPTVYGVDLSVTKHVFMLWVVAALVFVGVTVLVRRFVKKDRPVPTGPMTVLEFVVEFIRDGV